MSGHSFLDLIPDGYFSEMISLAQNVYELHPCVDWMSASAQNQHLQVCTQKHQNGTSFLARPRLSIIHNLLDMQSNHSVTHQTILILKFYIFSTKLARLQRAMLLRVFHPTHVGPISGVIHVDLSICMRWIDSRDDQQPAFVDYLCFAGLCASSNWRISRHRPCGSCHRIHLDRYLKIVWMTYKYDLR